MNERPRLFHWIYFAAIAPHWLEAPGWSSAVSIVLAFWSFAVHRSLIREPSKQIIQFMAIASLAAVFTHFETLLGPEPATTLLMILGGLKLLEVRSERDAVVFLFVAVLLVMYWLLFSQTLATTLYMLTMLVVVAMAFISLSAPRDELKRILRASPQLVGKDLLWSVPIFLACFFLFPRFSAPWSRLLAAQKDRMGFSNELKPGEMADLARSTEPAMRVQFYSEAPRVSDLYFRGVIMTVNRGFEWVEAKNRPSKPIVARKQNGDYLVVLEPRYGRNLFALDGTQSLHWLKSKRAPTIFGNEDQMFLTTVPLLSRAAYVGNLADESDKMPPEQLRRYLQLGFQPSDQLKELAESLRHNDLTSAVSRALNYYSENGFTYSLATPAMPKIDDFLFRFKSGFCEHYASSFAVLMRMMGIPARVVIGFQGGEYNEFDGTLLVKESNAHAWVEIHEESRGWMRIDPTAAVNRNRLDLGRFEDDTVGAMGSTSMIGKLYNRAAMAWDAVNYRYTQFILNYSSDDVMENFNLNISTAAKKWLLGLAALLSAAVILFLVSKIRFRTRVREDRLKMAFDNLLKRLNKKGLVDGDNLTPNQVGGTLIKMFPAAEMDIRELFNKYNKLRYGFAPEKQEHEEMIFKLNSFSIPD